jgi:Aspartyl/Asparaginyl beta-hydroxylase
MISRFCGSVSHLACVNASSLTAWIEAINLEKWPQQNRHELKPAMVTDPNWFGFGAVADPLVTSLMTHFAGCRPHNLMLSAVMPGHCIEPHADLQSDAWLCRVHSPLVSNEKSRFIVDGLEHAMYVGHAYRVNVLAEHSVVNDGVTPRIHFMFDVEKS